MSPCLPSSGGRFMEPLHSFICSSNTVYKVPTMCQILLCTWGTWPSPLQTGLSAFAELTFCCSELSEPLGETTQGQESRSGESICEC